MENRLAEAFKNHEFVVTCEFIPGRGATEDAQAKLIEEAKELSSNKRIQAFSITDNPSGNPALLADKFGEEILNLGVTPLVHFTCKDRNRSQMESQLDALERTGIQNLLCMSGDYPVSGWEGRAKRVFDLDAVQLLMMVNAMNEGLPYPARGGVAHQKPTHFFPGAVANPFKWTEAETITQYNKLHKKCVAGARFIISQVGYDSRKMQELLMVMKDQGHGDIPVIANIFILSAGVGRSMNAGNFPGCYVSDEFLSVLNKEKQAADKGREARIIRGAKMIAIARGLGYAGVHIGGIGVTPDVVSYVLEKADELQDNWEEWAKEISYGEPDAFYLYKYDPETGLNKHERSELAPARTDKAVQSKNGLSRLFHKMVFVPGEKMFPFMQWYMYNREKKKGPHRKHTIEHTGKSFLFGCMDCGDCGLINTSYVCPMVQCPKCQRNGPCGGSHDGWCEVYPGERLCIWYKAYHRYRKHGEEYKMAGYIVPPNNWDLFGGSAWAGYYLCRDNISNRIYLDDSLRCETPSMYKKQVEDLKKAAAK